MADMMKKKTTWVGILAIVGGLIKACFPGEVFEMPGLGDLWNQVIPILGGAFGITTRHAWAKGPGK